MDYIIHTFPSVPMLFDEIAPTLLLVIPVIIFTIFIKVFGIWVKQR